MWTLWALDICEVVLWLEAVRTAASLNQRDRAAPQSVAQCAYAAEGSEHMGGFQRQEKATNQEYLAQTISIIPYMVFKSIRVP